MAILIERQRSRPSLTDPSSLVSWLLDRAAELLDAMRSLVTLDLDTRATRSLNAERAKLFVSAVVVSTGITRLSALDSSIPTDVYTTALIAFDAGSGAGRWRMDGGSPVPLSVTAAAGLPIPSGGFTLTIVGAENIRSFQVTAETATTLNMSVQLFK